MMPTTLVMASTEKVSRRAVEKVPR